MACVKVDVILQQGAMRTACALTIRSRGFTRSQLICASALCIGALTMDWH